jgi:hypothetical protein
MPSPEIEIDALETQMTAVIVRDAEGSPETRFVYDSRCRARSRLRLKFQQLFQLRVLRFGFLEDGDVGIGVFPEREKILVGRFGVGGISLSGVGAAQL